MTIDAIAEASVGLKEEYIPMVVSYIDFLKSYNAYPKTPNKKRLQNKKRPKDAINAFEGHLLYMADDFNETPEEFKDYM